MKKILMLLAVAGLSSAAMAQQGTEVVEEEVGVIQVQDKYQVITNPFWSNWFFSIGGGAEATFGDNDKAGSFGKRISPTLNFSVGKWVTPGLGLRVQYSGLQARGFTYDVGAPYVRGTQMKDGYYKQRFDYMNLHGDVMFNLNALFGGYNQHRVYEIIPYVGAGFTHNYTNPHRDAMAVNGGIINRFRISNAIDINLEVSMMGVEDKFDGEVGGDHSYDGVLSATVGLTYRFPGRGFRRPIPQLISQVELAAMQAQLAELGAANQQLQNALVAAQNQPVAEVSETEVIVPDPDIAPRTVFFKIGSAEVSAREAMNLSYLANQMKEFPNATYTVNGYADSATGTPAFNQELSLKRAQAVVNVLVKQYGISADRLKISADGGVDKFGQPILNRVVLVKSAN
jgi:outer membrane protein OmpA-like peptidoglycan-associated protein